MLSALDRIFLDRDTVAQIDAKERLIDALSNAAPYAQDASEAIGTGQETPAAPIKTNLMPVGAVAIALGVSERTVWRLSGKKAIPQPIPVGRKKFWRAEDIETFLAARPPQPKRREYQHSYYLARKQRTISSGQLAIPANV